MRILLSGIAGHMGREVEKLCHAGYRGAELVCGVDPMGDSAGVPVYRSFDEVPGDVGIDCIIDFSHHSATEAMLGFATERGIPTVVATTGHTEDELKMIEGASCKIPVFHSGNMSLGIALLVELAKLTAAAMPEADIEIIERHHNRKLDAPSGTALMLAKAVCDVRTDAFVNTGRSGHGKREVGEIGIHAVRMGNIVGIHEVIVGTASQTITLKHEAHDRALFAEGGIAAAEFLVKCGAGLYDMKSIVADGAPAEVCAI